MTYWRPDGLRSVVEGGGWCDVEIDVVAGTKLAESWLELTAVRGAADSV